MKFFVILAILIPLIASANVVINEIAWMGSPPKARESASVASNNEWIELYNDSNEAVNFDGLTLIAEDNQPNITLSGTIPVGGYFLLERTDDETVLGIAADLIYTGALGNSGEKLELKNASGVIIDSVDASGGWPAGDNAVKETMQRTSAGGWITAVATPRAANAGAGSSSGNVGEMQPESSSAGASTPSSSSGAMMHEPKRFFTVDAGDDVTTVAGAEVHFQGAAFGFTGEPLQDDAARYLWNFGDGAFFEGKNMNHIYRYPGAYRAALYVSSGQTSGSDVIEVVVGESSVAISEIAGAWIELVNEGTAAVDLSSWQIRNGAGQIYALPAHTIIGRAAFVVFSQETTGLLFGQVNPKAELRYANGTLADALSFGGILLSEKSITRDDEGNAMMGEPTPGKENKMYHVASSKYHVEILKEEISKQEVNTAIGFKTGKEKNENEEKNPMIHDTSPMLQAKTDTSVFASNYFWLAASISIGLLAGAIVLALRTMILF